MLDYEGYLLLCHILLFGTLHNEGRQIFWGKTELR